ncbi:MHJ_0274 family protein [Mycoplasma corogypsi]|uniref:MHJ_0274 family protein n=1 Tax=Mycoplasma corogypsi TaxID=2106 RepID=UPI003873AF09
MDYTLIIWIILGILIGTVVVWFIYSYIKEKKDKKKLAIAAKQLEKETAIYTRELAISLKALTEHNKQVQSEFVPSIGEYKMSDLNNAAKNTILEITKSPKFKTCYLETQSRQKFVQAIMMLQDLNSNLWDKKLQSVVEVFDKFLDESEKQIAKENETDFIKLAEKQDLEKQIIDSYNEKLKQTKESNESAK